MNNKDSQETNINVLKRFEDIKTEYENNIKKRILWSKFFLVLSLFFLIIYGFYIFKEISKLEFNQYILSEIFIFSSFVLILAIIFYKVKYRLKLDYALSTVDLLKEMKQYYNPFDIKKIAMTIMILGLLDIGHCISPLSNCLIIHIQYLLMFIAFMLLFYLKNKSTYKELSSIIKEFEES